MFCNYNFITTIIICNSTVILHAMWDLLHLNYVICYGDKIGRSLLLSLKLVLFIVYAIRRTGQSGFPSGGFPTYRLINDTNTACKFHYYMPLCATYLNGSWT